MSMRVIDRGQSLARTLFVGSAIDDSDLDVYEFRLYAHLRRRAGDGEVWEKQENMAATCKMSRKKVNETLKSLEQKGWIQQEAQRRNGHRASNLIYLLEPPVKPGQSNPQLHSSVTDGYTAVSPTVTAKGSPSQGSPLEGKKREAPAAPARRNTPKPVISENGTQQAQEGPQTSASFLNPAADAAPAHAGNQRQHGPSQDQPSTQGRQNGQVTSTEQVPGGRAARGPVTTEAYLRRKLSSRFVDQVLDEIQPLGVDRRRDWFALPLDRAEQLVAEAQATHAQFDLKVPTRLRDLLDDECRRVNTPVRPAAPTTDDGEVDMDALMAAAPLNGTARRTR